MMMGVVGAEPGIAAEQSTDLEPVHVRHLGVEDDEIRLGSPDPFQRLLAGVGSDHGIAAGAQDAFE